MLEDIKCKEVEFPPNSPKDAKDLIRNVTKMINLSLSSFYKKTPNSE
jgi:hypothetical protein